MRKIGTMPGEEEAYRFGDFLYVKGIDNDVEHAEGEGFEIWVHDDAQLDAARAHLDSFLENPAAPEFSADSEAEKKRKQEALEDKKRKSRIINTERLGYERNFSAFAWLPMLLAVLSLAITIVAGSLEFLPERMQPEGLEKEERTEWRTTVFSKLMITEFRPPRFDGLKPDSLEDIQALAANPREILRRSADSTLPEVRSGEVWRLITPIFIHSGILHLVFNMMWLRDLGGFVHNRFGWLYLAVLVFISGALSNYAQLLWSGPLFGGMSGVNYAIFGFLWMRGKHDRFLAWTMDNTIVQMMLIWFFVCAVGLIPNVANMAHGAGLVIGMAWGFISGKLSRGTY
ncbi:MAG: Rhomboid protease GlpG [Verrucomicrobiota bacterium]|jgi:GlpG protein